MQNITPFLWFESRGEEAMNFYVSVFKDLGGNWSDSRILGESRYGGEAAKVSGQPEGSVMTGSFVLAGQEFAILNGGPEFKFSSAISFMINCDTQDEIDYFWEKLSDGGMTLPCGWLTDKFGVTWQVAPKVLGELANDPDKKKSERVMKAMLKMGKIEIKALEEAYDADEQS